MTDLYYKQDWKAIEELYNNSTLPKITVDLEALNYIKQLNSNNSCLLKYIINWNPSNNKDIEWIMNFIMRDAYLHFDYVKKIIYE